MTEEKPVYTKTAFGTDIQILGVLLTPDNKSTGILMVLYDGQKVTVDSRDVVKPSEADRHRELKDMVWYDPDRIAAEAAERLKRPKPEEVPQPRTRKRKSKCESPASNAA